MAKVQKRKYEKIDESEIDLVIDSHDSHEFYERYREKFPNKKKAIDSISKIWKRRGEFLKKRQESTQPEEQISEPPQNLDMLLREQNKIFVEMSGLMKEQLRVSKEILTRLPKQLNINEVHGEKPAEEKHHEPKEPPKKTPHEKPSEIMVGS